jgi:hypothetical protein
MCAALPNSPPHATTQSGTTANCHVTSPTEHSARGDWNSHPHYYTKEKLISRKEY